MSVVDIDDHLDPVEVAMAFCHSFVAMEAKRSACAEASRVPSGTAASEGGVLYVPRHGLRPAHAARRNLATVSPLCSWWT